ncbi:MULTISPECIES: 4Fe-4S dicluster domain-containing protein [Desulfobacula]|uniref:4Fe-4S ferredoxin domain protein n=2 Tax=Desulfobacula TaxID=28222 RepID=K0NI14_DESTT|nr:MULTISPECIES: reductive dehalogenase domain-containing protein [Desulfobacula]CCK79453.1 4Fe-4S ferredoxin domain protein [Desulfobacula toluolica Tol2]SDT84333.1 4Fe-4S dicluster domain-containing protein [Desulfobacula phenolica]
MDEKLKKYILIGLWVAAAASLVWFFASELNINALFAIMLCVAAAMGWWSMMFKITEKMRNIGIISMSSFWTIIAFFMFFPFPAPEAPQYIQGEVHRFSEMNHGFGRAYMGVLGPQINNHGYVYTDKEMIEPLAKARGGKKPSFTTTLPLSRALFGATTLLDGLRAPDQVQGEPVKVLKYPWTTFEGAHRDKKIGWNKGDVLLGNVAGKLGYKTAKYTPEENALMVKEIGLWLGSEDVGICRVDPRWFFSHDIMTAGTPLPLEKVEELKYGIQVFTDQRWRRVLNDPGWSWWSITKSGQAYSTSAFIAVRLAQTLRDMGYAARVGHGGINYETIETPFSVYCGLGEYGRLSDAVVPSVGGLRFKSATILTDFPMAVDPPRQSYGVTRFCSHCDRCARSCPVNAIPMGKRTIENGIEMWHVDKDKCVRFRTGNLNGNCCNECLKSCPYNKPATAFHLMGNYMLKHSYLAPFLFGNVNGVGLEDWLDYQYGTESKQFGVNRPARWILENPGFKTEFPRKVGRYIYTEEDRSPDEEWATGVGAKMGKVGVTYKGIQWGEIPARLLDENGRSKNVHWDNPKGELDKDVKAIGKVLTKEEADAMLKEGKAFSGGWYKKDEDVYPRRSKYEKGTWSYEKAADDWAL